VNPAAVALEYWRRHPHHRLRPVVVFAELTDQQGQVVARAWAVFIVAADRDWQDAPGR
jgi:hypothetical protein